LKGNKTFKITKSFHVILVYFLGSSILSQILNLILAWSAGGLVPLFSAIAFGTFSVIYGISFKKKKSIAIKSPKEKCL
jgi:ABC-type multidrug transport system permease subunit